MSSKDLPKLKLNPYELVWIQCSAFEFLIRNMIIEKTFDDPTFSQDLAKTRQNVQDFLEKHREMFEF